MKQLYLQTATKNAVSRTGQQQYETVYSRVSTLTYKFYRLSCYVLTDLENLDLCNEILAQLFSIRKNFSY